MPDGEPAAENEKQDGEEKEQTKADGDMNGDIQEPQEETGKNDKSGDPGVDIADVSNGEETGEKPTGEETGVLSKEKKNQLEMEQEDKIESDEDKRAQQDDQGDDIPATSATNIEEQNLLASENNAEGADETISKEQEDEQSTEKQEDPVGQVDNPTEPTTQDNAKQDELKPGSSSPQKTQQDKPTEPTTQDSAEQDELKPGSSSPQQTQQDNPVEGKDGESVAPFEQGKTDDQSNAEISSTDGKTEAGKPQADVQLNVLY